MIQSIEDAKNSVFVRVSLWANAILGIVFTLLYMWPLFVLAKETFARRTAEGQAIMSRTLSVVRSSINKGNVR